MTTVFEFQARKIERMAASLAHFVATTAEDRLTWCPSAQPNSCTRSVLAQVDECIRVNRYCAALLRGETPAYEEANESAVSESRAAQQQLLASGRELAAVVRKLDDDALTKVYPHWSGPVVGEVLIEAPYRNMAYHAGQVNMIQLLTGDPEFHRPPTWLSPE